MSSFVTLCAVCGVEVEAQRSTRRTCSAVCRAILGRRQRSEKDVAAFRAQSADLLERALVAATAGDDAALETIAAEVAAFRP